ncbi:MULTISPECIES: septum formation family protein [unclassified Nocardiopsis]|uniref:septum formation family protein n=1 Tax=unclassified Nocardiopsis TaxID=2649073 RepID=UPI0013595F1D|nr:MULTISPECIES: septum formation family protein [unclassified Nocardiopsis]
MLSDPRRPLLGRLSLGTLTIGAALALTACGPLPLLPPAFQNGGDDAATVSPEPTDTGTPAEPVETGTTAPAGPEDTGVDAVYVGDCLNEMSTNADDSVSEVPKIECSEPHDYEIYHAGDLADSDTYPGEDSIAEMAGELCVGEFEAFVGLDYASSRLEVLPLYPTEEGWNELYDREVLCLLSDPAGQTTGSLAGSGI